MLKRLLLTGLLLLNTFSSWAATTYYVRTDGGRCGDITSSYYDATPETFFAKECDGKTDAALAGADGTNCACNHPNWVLGTTAGNAAMYSAGDTVVIKAGSYQMGCVSGSPHCLDYRYNLNQSGICYDGWASGCILRPVISGSSSSTKTTILGEGWDTGCTNPPELWGAGWINRIINLEDSNNVDIRCLKITDHEDCTGQGPNAYSCSRVASELSSKDGIYAEDSSDVSLKDITIWGMTYVGIHAGRLNNWSLENVVMKYNSFAGWDGDISGLDSNTGDINWTNVKILWNGCADDYPNDAPKNCYSQDQGGYGDGVGTGATVGNWNIIGSEISYNVSDGLDLLYMLGGSVYVNRSRFEGNAGNQIKVGGANSKVENSVIVGNCAHWSGATYSSYSQNQPGRSGSNCNNNSVCDANENSIGCSGDCPGFNSCRSGGDFFATQAAPNISYEFYNNTWLSSVDNINGGSVFLIANVASNCNGTTTFSAKNNIFDGGGGGYAHYSQDKPLFEQNMCNGLSLVTQYNIYNTAAYRAACPSGTGMICADPKVDSTFTGVGSSGGVYGIGLEVDSPARDAADETVPVLASLDFYGSSRGVSWDIGAVEYGSVGAVCDNNHCFLCALEDDCVGASCYWYNSICNVTAQGSGSNARQPATGRIEATGRATAGNRGYATNRGFAGE